MDETLEEETAVVEPPPRAHAGNGLTPAQLKAAAKVVRTHLAHEAQRLRHIPPPPDRDKPSRGR